MNGAIIIFNDEICFSQLLVKHNGMFAQSSISNWYDGEGGIFIPTDSSCMRIPQVFRTLKGKFAEQALTTPSVFGLQITRPERIQVENN